MNILPNFGRDVGMYRPVDIDHIFPDPPGPLEILLITTLTPGSLNRTHAHMQICWQVGTRGDHSIIYRRLQVVKEIDSNHLTNWGPITKNMGIATVTASEIAVITTMTLQNRQNLEQIAANTPVYVPDGRWNCQDWVKDVLRQAVDRGLVTDKEVEATFSMHE
ncbi:hypothetical protein GG344DRAFT_58966 [Lentinula edodes]|nr:hypothetical protein GG344DRAFT_58966 [Lentinula edodes]